VKFLPLAALSALLVLAGCQSQRRIEVSADGTQFDLKNTISVPSGLPQSQGFFTRLNLDCSQAEIPVVRVALAPAHGKLQTAQVDDFPKFTPPSPLVKCNAERRRGVKVTFTPDAGYAGADEFVFEIFANGRVARAHTTVNVL
jgi:hypothetical protein